MGKFIFDELTGTPTLLAADRAKRIDQTGAVNTISNVKPSEVLTSATCIFCKGNEQLTTPTVYQDADDWRVRVFKNKFPLLEDHEIIVHSPKHDEDIEDVSCEQGNRIIRAYLNRVSYYGSQDKEVFIFNTFVIFGAL